MTRFIVAGLVAAFFAGCRAPTPTISDFAPFGSTTVNPPSTGAIGSAGSYYPSNTSPAVAVPTAAPTPAGPVSNTPATGRRSQVLPPPGVLGTSSGAATSTPLAWKHTDVRQASYETNQMVQNATVAANQVLPPDMDPLPGSGTQNRSSSLQLRGMPVNEVRPLSSGSDRSRSTMSTNPGVYSSRSARRSPALLRIINPDTSVGGSARTSSSTGDGWQRR